MSSRLEFHARVVAAKPLGLLSARQQDHEFDDEIRGHLELLADRIHGPGHVGGAGVASRTTSVRRHDLVARLWGKPGPSLRSRLQPRHGEWERLRRFSA